MRLAVPPCGGCHPLRWHPNCVRSRSSSASPANLRPSGRRWCRRLSSNQIVESFGIDAFTLNRKSQLADASSAAERSMGSAIIARAIRLLRHKARFEVGPRCQVKFGMRVPVKFGCFVKPRDSKSLASFFQDPVGSSIDVGSLIVASLLFSLSTTRIRVQTVLAAFEQFAPLGGLGIVF